MNRMTIWPIGHSQGMMEWWWNEVYFRTKGLALNQKYPSFHPHSVIPSSFLNDETDWNEVRMSRMTTEWYPSIVIFIPCHFLAFWNEKGMTEWGGMMVFLEVDKNTEFWDNSHPATIRSFQPHSFLWNWAKEYVIVHGNISDFGWSWTLPDIDWKSMKVNSESCGSLVNYQW